MQQYAKLTERFHFFFLAPIFNIFSSVRLPQLISVLYQMLEVVMRDLYLTPDAINMTVFNIGLPHILKPT